jgi:hypothetical protein
LKYGLGRELELQHVLVHGTALSLLTTSDTLSVVEWQVFSREPSY